VSGFASIIVLAASSASIPHPVDVLAELRSVYMPYVRCERSFDERRLALAAQFDALYAMPSATAEERSEQAKAWVAYNETRFSFNRDKIAACKPRDYLDRLTAKVASLNTTWPKAQADDFAIQFATRMGQLEEMTADYVSGCKPAPAPYPPAPAPSPRPAGPN